jgi:hypothetical protein
VAQQAFDLAPAFEEIRPLFDREPALLNVDRMNEWEATWESVAALDAMLKTQSP